MKNKNHICPWQAGSVLAGSFRGLLHNPYRILKSYLKEGITGMDIGCGMGFFTIPMSKIISAKGKVLAVDLQSQMLEGLKTNTEKSAINNITLHQCSKVSLNIESWNGTVNFALIFWMLHEVPDADRLIREVHQALSENGKLLFAEPFFHVGKKQFRKSLAMIQQSGFEVIEEPGISFSRAALVQKI